MALIFADSFDHYTTAIGSRKWDSFGSVIASVGRRGSQGLNFNQHTMVRNIGNQATLIAGCAIFPAHSTFNALTMGSGTLAGTMTSKGYVLGFGYQSIADCGVMFTNDGKLHAVRGGAFDLSSGAGGIELIGSSAPNKLKFTGWNYLECKVLISAGAGSIIIRVNGVEVFSDLNTRTAHPSAVRDGATHATQFYMGGGTYGALSGQGWSGKVDDLYLFNGLGGIHNDFIGDVNVAYLKPNGAGVASDSTLGGTSPAPTRWQATDDQTPDDEVTYIALEADDDEDLYEHEDLPFDEAEVFAVQGVLCASKNEVGIANVVHRQRVTALDDQGAAQVPAGGEYAYLLTPFDESADGAWTLAKVNASQFGVKRVAA